MHDGYSLLKSLEFSHHNLKSTDIDDDNLVLSTFIEHFHLQLQTCEQTFIETIRMLKEIQLNINKFDNSCRDIQQTIAKQKLTFENLIRQNDHLQIENLNQQIQILKTIQTQIEHKINSMIDTLKQTTKQTTNSQIKIDQLNEQNQQLKSSILVRRSTLFLPQIRCSFFSLERNRTTRISTREIHAISHRYCSNSKQSHCTRTNTGFIHN